ncbi:hypothetical protein [Streptomyces monashensis]|nr:hypothetical protein [Streptomyces monashensis]
MDAHHDGAKPCAPQPKAWRSVMVAILVATVIFAVVSTAVPRLAG